MTALLLWLLIQGGEQPPRAGTITITAPDRAPVTLTAADLAKAPRQSLKVTTEAGGTVEYQGIALPEVLKLAKVPLGAELRGRTIAGQYLVITAADGQQAVFALAEVDPSFAPAPPLLADKANGMALSADEGPWRLIPPHDKRRARSLRQVTGIQVKKL